MRRNLKNLFVLGGLLLGASLYAQEKTVTGTVTDPDGFPVADAVVKSSSGKEVYTDENGVFSIEAISGDKITVTSQGLPTQNFVVGDSATYKVSLKQSDTIELEGAVVTALGITRDKRSLGYSTQQVSGETISAAPVSNFADALSGEVAGLDIKSSGTMGGSSNMVIRGFGSLTGNNQALIVVDGTPINNGTSNTADQTTGRGGFDYGNAASDINPNDIESLNVLKGSAATALYGSRGQSGVIMITTKRGKKNKGIGVEFNSAITIGTADKATLPKYQTKYGAGYDAEGSSAINPYFDAGPNGSLVTQFGADASYGAAFDPNLMVYQWNSLFEGLSTYGKATPWLAAKNDPNSIWGVSSTYVNSASFSGSNDQGSFRLGVTNNLTNGNLVNSELKRNTVSFNGEYKLTDNLKATASVIYTNNKGKGRVGTGYDGLNPMQAFRQWWQTNVDLKEQEQAYLLTKRNASWNVKSLTNNSPQYTDNYYWVRYENFQNDSRDRYTGNVALDYKVNNWLSFTGRYSFDNYDELREGRVAVGSAGSLGEYMYFKQSVSENNYDFMANINKNITDDINFDANVGWNLRVEKTDRFIGSTNGGLSIPGLFTLANSKNALTAADISQFQGTKKVDGMFARASIGFYNMLYIDGSIRTYRSSTLLSTTEKGNRYWYPSVSTSFVFSELVKGSFINFGKVRANFARVGNDTNLYNLYNTYALNASFNGTGSATNPSQSKNQFLQNEMMREYEVGLEMGMFKNRVSFDVSYYNRKTYDLITPVDISSSSGSSSLWMNAGDMVNKGIEAAVTLIPIKSEDFTWKLGVNFAKNTNEVTALAEGVNYLQLASLQGSISIGAQVGEAYGVIRGTGFVYDDNGNKVVKANGQYQASASTTVIGNMNPDWTGGVKNTFTYKNLSLSFLIDFQKGGDVFSLDTWYGYATGLYDNFTSGLNDLGNPVRNSIANGGGVILPGVDANGNANTVRVEASTGYNNPWGYLAGTAPREAHVYDASFVKLRNLTLTYDLPDRILNSAFIKKFSVSAIGRNLWIIHKNVPYSDPEAGLSAGNIQGFQSGAHPTIREIGASIKVQF